jgi:cystathionine gamma-synthase
METRAVEAGRSSASGAPLNAPLVPASSFRIGAEREYSRNDGTPTWEAFEAVVGALERAEAVAFSSGMAAIVAVFDQLPVGGRIAWPEDCYHGVAGITADGERLGRWTASRLAVEDTDAWCEAAASAPDVDRVAIEPVAPRRGPSPDRLHTTARRRVPRDRQHACRSACATAVGSRRRHRRAVGDEAPRRAFRSSLRRGDDTTRGARSPPAQASRATRLDAGDVGDVPGHSRASHNPLRAAAAAASAQELARRLEAPERVERVRYPGLESHPSHAVAEQHLANFGSVISFDVAGGAEAADLVCRRVQLIRHATSFGRWSRRWSDEQRSPARSIFPPGS